MDAVTVQDFEVWRQLGPLPSSPLSTGEPAAAGGAPHAGGRGGTKGNEEHTSYLEVTFPSPKLVDG